MDRLIKKRLINYVVKLKTYNYNNIYAPDTRTLYYKKNREIDRNTLIQVVLCPSFQQKYF